MVGNQRQTRLVFNDCIRRAKTLVIKWTFEAIVMILNIPSWLFFFHSLLLLPLSSNWNKGFNALPLGPHGSGFELDQTILRSVQKICG